MQSQMSSAMENAKGAAATVSERVTDFLQGNPFETPVGRKIEMATDATILEAENWGLNMEICDFINSTVEGGRDAMRAIRKRLHTQMSKNHAGVMYTLTVLETCVKNCDIRFHELVCQKEFVNDLVRLIGPKYDAPQVVQERVLTLIKAWNDAFRDDQRLQGVCQVYDDLKAKGVEFPVIDPESTAPILTPKRTVYPVDKSGSAADVASGNAHGGGARAMPCATGVPLHLADPIELSGEQLVKLRKDLDVVQTNLSVAREILSELVPGKEDREQLELLKQLRASLLIMHSRIMTLISCVKNEEVIYELLMVNDDLNNFFEKFDRYKRKGALRSDNANGAANAAETDLIEFDDDVKLSNAVGAVQISDASNVGNTAKASGSGVTVGEKTTEQAPKADALMSDKEAAEMVEWLEAQEGKKKDTEAPGTTEPSEGTEASQQKQQQKEDTSEAPH